MIEAHLDVLLIEDNPGDARLIEEMLDESAQLGRRVEGSVQTDGGSLVHHERRLAAGIERLDEGNVDVVLLDLGLPDSDGLETLAAVLEATSFVPIVVLTGLRDEAVGLEAIQRGAQDYLVKDEVTSDLLVRSIHHAIERNRQEREGVRRREQLEALNGLTRTLMDAGSPAEVSEYVVENAATRLDLSLAAIVLYDDQEGVLRLAEATDDAEATVDLDALLAVGDGAGWQAFAGGETTRLAPGSVEADPTIHGSITELVVIPLSRHGVFVTGSTESGGFSPTDVDFVETVARNLTATLDRVDREQTLHDRERTLEEQNRTLERMSRITDIVRRVARGIVRTSSQAEIETVVCEELADAGPYELAWIGDHDAAAGTVTPRASTGNAKGYLDGLSIRTDGGPQAEGPTGRAVRTREPQVVNDVLDDPSFDPWRRAALERGYHASIVLPLCHEETLYGVLTVYAGQPDVFDELERAVLAELADTIAHAIDAVERARASASGQGRRLRFALGDVDAGIGALARDLACDLSVEDLVCRSDGSVRGFVRTRGTPADAVLARADDVPALDLALLSSADEDGESDCLFRAELTAESPTATAMSLGGRPGDVRFDGSTATLAVDLGPDVDGDEFVDSFLTTHPGSAVVDSRTVEQPCDAPAAVYASLTEALTDRQLEAIQTAYRCGFFESPREHSGREVADAMGISQPTFNAHLRAAHRKLCRQLFDDGSPAA